MTADISTRLELRISANFSLGLITETIQLLTHKAGIPATVRALEKVQALPHASRLAYLGRIDGQVDIFVLDLMAWLDSGETSPTSLADIVTVFSNTLEVALSGDAEVIVALAPDAVGIAQEDAMALSRARAQFTKLAHHNPQLALLDLEDAVVSYEVSDTRTTHREVALSLPFTDEFQVSAGALIARHVFVGHGHHYKAIVVDCDNTLWTGECASPAGVTLTDGNLLLQTKLLQLVAQGYLICLASKNEPEDVMTCLRNTAGMLLTEDDITDSEIGWSSKSEGIRALAERLHLSPDAFIFIDDDSFECADVSYHHRSTIVIPFTNEVAELRRYLAHIWPFDSRSTVQTAEDSLRTTWYQTDAIRQSHAKAGDLDTFLSAIGLSVQITASKESDLPRLAQLTHRAQQWNNLASGQSPRALASRAKAHLLFSVRVQDRYGDYGIVGILGCATHEDTLSVDIMALSCRALGKSVEFSALHHFVVLAERYGLTTIDIAVHCTDQRDDATSPVRVRFRDLSGRHG